MPNSFSTACLTSIFVARGATSNTTTVAALAGDRGLLGDERAADDIGGFHPNTSCSRSTAARVAMMRVGVHHVARRQPAARHERTPAMLRADRLKFSSSFTSTTSVLARRAQPLQQRRRRLRLALGRLQLVDDDHGALARAWPSAPPCSAPRSTFFGSVVVVAARLRAEHRAAVPPERRARRSDLRAARCPSACRASCRCR